MFLRSLAYGYIGAVLAGLAVGVLAVSFGLSEEATVAAAMPVGLALGTLGLCVPWRRTVAARLRGRRDGRASSPDRAAAGARRR